MEHWLQTKRGQPPNLPLSSLLLNRRHSLRESDSYHVYFTENSLIYLISEFLLLNKANIVYRKQYFLQKQLVSVLFKDKAWKKLVSTPIFVSNYENNLVKSVQIPIDREQCLLIYYMHKLCFSVPLHAKIVGNAISQMVPCLFDTLFFFIK